jgi:hypothetical protein
MTSERIKNMSSAEVILLGILDTKKKIITSKLVTKISMASLTSFHQLGSRIKLHHYIVH